MQPPVSLDPLFDARGGFSTLTKLGEIVWRHRVAAGPRRRTTLLSFDEAATYGLHTDVTRALYRLELYRCCPLVAWFDNQTGARLD